MGDITYTNKTEADRTDQTVLYDVQWLAAYTSYPKQIVAIAGNHDGKNKSSAKKSAIQTFLANFCADPQKWPAKWEGNTIDSRPAMIQPYPYWRFDTPLAYFIGLDANISNGGMLDDPSANQDFKKGPQYKWLVNQLKLVKAENGKRAILLTVHYPPYSGATNFNVRGDQQQGQTPDQANAPYLAAALQEAFKDAGQRPDAIFSAHAHLFQRLTYTFADTTVMPCVVVGCGGHSLEYLFEACDGTKDEPAKVPFPAVAPGTFQFPAGESAVVDAYEDNREGGKYGFVEINIKARVLTCTFYNTSGSAGDMFQLDLEKHQYKWAIQLSCGRRC